MAPTPKKWPNENIFKFFCTFLVSYPYRLGCVKKLSDEYLMLAWAPLEVRTFIFKTSSEQIGLITCLHPVHLVSETLPQLEQAPESSGSSSKTPMVFLFTYLKYVVTTAQWQLFFSA
jgi:hypothetical protein